MTSHARQGSPDPLIIIAHRLEAAYLPDYADVVITGIGMSRAAVATTRAIMERWPTAEERARAHVVNLGSVGSLKDGLAGLHRPSLVINRDVDEELMLAMDTDPANRIELGGDGPVLGTGDSFVAGGAARDELAKRCDLVDMEGYAIAYACGELGVKMTMIKHVSDSADEGALAWEDLVDISAKALAEAYAAL
ncbi:nucleosidase [Mariniluteicoccus endophyticus]